METQVMLCAGRRSYMLLGLAGPKSEAGAIKSAIAAFLRDELHLTLRDEKTLMTHARDEKAQFLGYEVHILHENKPTRPPPPALYQR